jgi:hypothetical protein
LAVQQAAVLNIGFEGTPFSFSLRDIRFHTFSRYATIETGPEMADMIAAHHVGDTKTLNLFVPFEMGRDLGIGACVGLNDLFGSRTFSLKSDGCAISYNTRPGSASKYYNEGKTAVHEAGHWLGLSHTFEGGCTGPGDYIADTPAQAHMTMTCDETQDTCPLSPGLDPIHNYMGYSPE